MVTIKELTLLFLDLYMVYNIYSLHVLVVWSGVPLTLLSNMGISSVLQIWLKLLARFRANSYRTLIISVAP